MDLFFSERVRETGIHLMVDSGGEKVGNVQNVRMDRVFSGEEV